MILQLTVSMLHSQDIQPYTDLNISFDLFPITFNSVPCSAPLIDHDFSQRSSGEAQFLCGRLNLLRFVLALT